MHADKRKSSQVKVQRILSKLINVLANEHLLGLFRCVSMFVS